MKTTLGGPRDVRATLEGSLQELQAKQASLEAEKVKVETRDVSAESKTIAQESKFKLKDLLPSRWKRIFVKREKFEQIHARLSKAREDDLAKARAELKTIQSVTEPFRALCNELAALSDKGNVEQLQGPALQGVQDRQTAALAKLDLVKQALDAAGTCEATASFPVAQLEALRTAITGDVAALREKMEAEKAQVNKQLADAVQIFVRHAEGERAQQLANLVVKPAVVKLVDLEAPLQRPIVEAPVQKPVEVPAVKPAEVPAAKPAEVIVAKPVEMPAVKPAEVIVAKPVEVPAQRPVEVPAFENPGAQSFRERRLAHAGQVAKDDDGGPVANANPVVAPARAKVADKQGPLSHLGQPVQFGAEKENNMKTMSAGDKLQATTVQGFDRALLKGKVTADMLVDGAKGKTDADVQWADLNDKGKSVYSLAYSEKYTVDSKKPKWPIIKPTPQATFSAVDFEPNGWIEVISSKFDTIKQANVFLDKFGYGHIHTTWMRGAKPEVQLQQTTWMRNANMWMFLDALEHRGASSGGEAFWRFAIKGLSIPTEDHLKLALEMIRGRNMTATAFSKHLHIGMRASGKYGDRNRIGFEARGGVEDQKKRVLDSLLNGLCQEQWGAVPAKYGEEEFKLVTVGSTEHQVSSLPREFESLVRRHLEKSPVGNLTPNDAGRLYNLVAGATFYDGRVPNARLNAFDQRGCTPLLEFEKLSWLTDDEKKRAVGARGKFIQALADLDAKKAGMSPSKLGLEVAKLMENWAKDARLSDAFGRWLDGGERQHFFS